ncbi:MAG: recombinase [Tissierellia bacterium]|nr:recombinase [Tissierellia bacterium]
MTHIPYGYKIENGKYIIDEEKAKDVRVLFQNYMEDKVLIKAIKNTGIRKNHSTIKRMLSNKKYVGDEGYPTIIDNETFNIVADILIEKTKIRNAHVNNGKRRVIPREFYIKKAEMDITDPFKKAKWIYSRIEIRGDSHEK